MSSIQELINDGGTLEGVDDLFAWSRSSSFGNFLSERDVVERERVRSNLSRKLEARRTSDGIQLQRYLVFASARRP
jgi:hypothetical protein